MAVWVLVVTFVCRASLMVVAARLVLAWSVAAIMVVMIGFLSGMMTSSRFFTNIMLFIITVSMIPGMTAALLSAKRLMMTIVLVE